MKHPRVSPIIQSNFIYHKVTSKFVKISGAERRDDQILEELVEARWKEGVDIVMVRSNLVDVKMRC